MYVPLFSLLPYTFVGVFRGLSSSSSWLVFCGGMPRANYSDRHTVSVVHGPSHITFDFSSRVIDFLLLTPASDSDGTLG